MLNTADALKVQSRQQYYSLSIIHYSLLSLSKKTKENIGKQKKTFSMFIDVHGC